MLSKDTGNQIAALIHKTITMTQKENCCDKLYVEILAMAAHKQGKAVMAGSHTHVVDETYAQTTEPAQAHTSSDETKDIRQNLRLVCDFATTAPLDEIQPCPL